MHLLSQTNNNDLVLDSKGVYTIFITLLISRITQMYKQV